MEHHEEESGARAAEEPDHDAAVGHRSESGAAGPQQSGDDGFGTGFDQEPDTAQENQKPNFARGISHEDVPGTEHEGRFSEGQEQLPETPEKDVEGRFSEGQEHRSTGR